MSFGLLVSARKPDFNLCTSILEEWNCGKDWNQKIGYKTHTLKDFVII